MPGPDHSVISLSESYIIISHVSRMLMGQIQSQVFCTGLPDLEP